jgi:hypothetical protein
MATSNINWQALSDTQVVERLGAELRRMLLERNLRRSGTSTS